MASPTCRVVGGERRKQWKLTFTVEMEDNRDLLARRGVRYGHLGSSVVAGRFLTPGLQDHQLSLLCWASGVDWATLPSTTE